MYKISISKKFYEPQNNQSEIEVIVEGPNFDVVTKKFDELYALTTVDE